ncbi:MAG: hypothetical protein A3D96_00880 [Chlamydiae bacterium RIFCSPHIGHO2_12_FULL_44_59]|nr:MAG: hypothetical protein A2796_00455 [Chlamydiae bacterium RIFCSPHIGHO2_01_FULL_44_39]OGN59246.1 MAG: hypothetical protein A3C42_03970 [Chlamydiae bacterium RIFCSPHIGHO2_02_FULL_45_9]OGN60425.1 MAG: hypothetical protein A3D96_00880 [Chlamydiae bacterium RIFCSPHIGHO2_12_FULL_44_59]OGN66546.1 MAG: hypothetical protein A2978_05065 [Chlamydiae bacterium RIFCSPLOWO2_01_FULL_44_52]OGN69796.1 MAG: hypothetical protein A3I67_06820 [Chlamydiae bacterium RIFCSPLOWO2_02_FULL_45_22]OGN70336.1 MAG: hyp
MEHHPIATIVNFSSNESRFIQATLSQVLLFSRQVIVPVCDHFFDGTLENRVLLKRVYEAFPECQFIEYPFEPAKIPKAVFKKINPAHFWHSLSRLIGVSHLDEEIETVLFLDADEVPDGHRFGEWLRASDYRGHTAIKFSNYWYFRDPVNQAIETEDSVVLAQRGALELEIVLHQDERDAIYHLLPWPKRRGVKDFCGNPMFHHYSWVRTKEEMLKKVGSWGHKKDRDWVRLVHEEFAGPFSGRDFIHNYHYRQIAPLFDIRLEEPAFVAMGKPQVKQLKSREVLSLLPKKKFWGFVSS